MSDVFVSYKAEDRRRVQPLVEALQADGLTVWWDEHIGTGDAWRETIERQLDQARCVVVIWSKRSVGPEGRFVREEASRAQRRGAYVPVLIDAVEPPLGFGESQATPLRRWHGDRSDPHYRALLSAIRRNVGHDDSAEAHGGKQARVDRRTMIAGGAVAAAAVAVAGGWALFRSSSAEASSHSIAVLPFENLSGDPAQAYFSDGVAEEIRSALARVAGLKVVGRTSSEAVRNDDAQTAARKLDVASILTGTVRQSPSTIRVSAELVDGGTGIDKWSQDYDRSPGDAIKIQTDIAENVASALSAALGVAAKAAVSIGGTQNPAAQRLFIQATSIVKGGGGSKADYEKALQLFDSAISLDARYADAYAHKASTLVVYENSYSNAEELPKNRAEALRLANIAVSIAPGLAAGHRALSAVFGSNLQVGPSFTELRRARMLAPSDVDTLSALSNVNASLGNSASGISLADQAIALDPLNPLPYAERLSALFLARRYQDAVSYGQAVGAKFPQRKIDAAPVIGDCLLLLGKSDAAQASYNLAPPDYWRRLTGEAILHVRAGDKAGGEQKLAQLRQEFGDAASTQFAEIYAQMGDKDSAFTALDHGYAIKDAGIFNLKMDPFLDPLRSDPRFVALVQKMDFPIA